MSTNSTSTEPVWQVTGALSDDGLEALALLLDALEENSVEFEHEDIE